MADTGKPLLYRRQIMVRITDEQRAALAAMGERSGKDRSALVRDGIELLRAVYEYEEQQAHPRREQ